MENEQHPAAYIESEEFAVWQKYEDIAMHFNDLIMRLRTQALGALTGIIALSGVVLSVTEKAGSEAMWEVLFGISMFLTIAWLALWIIDMGYYNRLLLGAVEAIVEREAKSQGRINVSTKIENRVREKKGGFHVVNGHRGFSI